MNANFMSKAAPHTCQHSNSKQESSECNMLVSIIFLLLRSVIADIVNNTAPTSTDSACKAGTTLARFVINQPNSSTIVAVGGNAIVEWTYAPPAW